MIWLIPGAVAAACIVFLFGAKRSQRVSVVSSHLLVQRIALRGSSPVRSLRPKQWFSLLLFLLMCGALSALAVQESLRSNTHRAVVVDASASMGANGRWERAIQTVTSSWTNGPLLAFDSKVYTVMGPTAEAQLAENALVSLRPAGVSMALPEMIRAAQKIVPNYPLVVISDASPPRDLPPDVSWRRIRVAADNMGVVSGGVERLDSLGQVTAKVVLHFEGLTPNTRALHWAVNGQRVHTESVTLAPGETVVRTWTGAPRSPVSIRASLEPEKGDWGADDVAEMSLPSLQPVAVSGVDVGRFWKTAIEAHPMAEWVEDVQRADIVIVGGMKRPEVDPEKWVFVGAGVSHLGVAQRVSAPHWTWTDEASPLLSYVELEQIRSRQFYTVRWRDARPLAMTTEGLGVGEGVYGGRPALAWGFELQSSDAALRTDFVNWVANVVEWGGEARAWEPAVSEQNPLAIQETKQASDVVLEPLRSRSWNGWWMLWAIAAGLAIVEALSWGARWKTAGKAAVFTRMTLMVTLGLGALAPWLPWFERAPVVVELTDGSFSMGTEVPARDSGFVVGADPRSESTLTPVLEQVIATIPAGAKGELSLRSDGRFTDATWTQDAMDEFVRPHSVALKMPNDVSDLRAECVLSDHWVQVGGALHGTLKWFGYGRVHWTLDGVELGGVNEAPADVSLQWDIGEEISQGPHTVEVYGGGRLLCKADVVVRGPQRVLLVSDQPNSLMPLKALLETNGFAADVLTPGDAAMRELSDVSTVVLGSAMYVTGNALSRWLPRVQDEVARGMGLVTLGGMKSYDGGHWGLGPLSELLPVDLEQDEKALDSRVSFLAVLDKSGSMAYDSGGKPRMTWANSAVLASLKQLRSTDRAGVLAVDTELHWTVSMQELGDGDGFAEVRQIRGGSGGIYVYSALKEALNTMRQETSPVRHVVLLVDAQDAAEKVKGKMYGWAPGPSSLDVVKQMVEEGMTVTVMAIGERRDQDAAFLKMLANIGDGRYHITQNAADLVGFFTQETQRMVDDRMVDGPIRPVRRQTEVFFEGVIEGSAAALSGMSRVEPAVGAQTFWETQKREPILTHWRMGLGRVSSFMAGPEHIGMWRSWPDAERFWTQWVRWSGQEEWRRSQALQIHGTANGWHASTRKGWDAASVPILKRIDGVEVVMQPTARGRWTTSLATHSEALRQVVLKSSSGLTVDSQWLPRVFPAEYGPSPANAPQAVTRYAATPRLAAWPWWVGLAFVLLPLNVITQRRVRHGA